MSKNSYTACVVYRTDNLFNVGVFRVNKNVVRRVLAEKLVVKLAEKKRIAPLYTVGIKYKALVFISRLFPHKTAVGIVGKMYK